jgi:bifunctional non-homologous end joining protein LigD
VLDDLGVTWFLQTSGSKGFHLVVPLVPDGDHEAVLRVAGAVAAESVRRDPEGLTVEFSKAERHGRIYTDIGRNGPAQTSAAPYSIRARPGAPVATPIELDELDRAEPQSWTLHTIEARLAAVGDPWARIDDHAQPLPAV